MRDKATVKRIKMYKGGKPIRNKEGKIVKAAPFQDWLPLGTVARVEPNRRWFGNTRVVSQSSLQTFQNELGKVIRDPYQVVMRQSKLPITLLQERAKHARVHVLETESFESTFGKKKQRKRPTLKAADVESLVKSADDLVEKYDSEKDRDLVRDDDGMRKEAREPIFSKGTSTRIWGELYKVIDSSDVVVQVLDARDPQGTRSKHIENYLKREKQYKHLIFILNKVDLVPTWVTQKWVAILSHDYPTLAFHASVNNPFGKGALIQLLRQFAKLHLDKKQISVGFIGYPNVGKSSVINTLRAKKVCKVAPIAGETKVWQYITLMRRIFLIDCPGVVYPTGETETELVLKGVVRVENVKNPEDYVGAVLERVKPEYIQRTYNIAQWKDDEDFLEQMARKTGKLLKGGEPAINTVAKMVLNDWQRGKVPYFVKPPETDQEVRERIHNEKKEKEKMAEAKTANDEKMESSNEKEIESTTDEVQFAVSQDLTKISVEPEFVGEDIQDIVPMETTVDDDAISDDDDEEEEEKEDDTSRHRNQEDGKEESGLVINKDSGVLKSALTFLGGKKTNQQKLAGFKIKQQKFKKTRNEITEQKQSDNIQSSNAEEDNEKIETGKIIDVIYEDESENEELLNDADEDNPQLEESDDDDDDDNDGGVQIKDTEYVTMVEMMPSPKQKHMPVKKGSKKRKRCYQEEEEEERPSKKELRREHKKRMRQKTGSRYYDTVNVKNKNYPKRGTTSEKHTRSKKRKGSSRN
ncbi:uncharacterized protein LOC100368042 [Saccoglossus kowalevskii]